MSGGGAHYIVKRGRTRTVEDFNEKKLLDSIIATCLTARTGLGEAEAIARNVLRDVLSWLKAREEVTSNDIRRVAAESLEQYHKDAAYLYKQHKATI